MIRKIFIFILLFITFIYSYIFLIIHNQNEFLPTFLSMKIFEIYAKRNEYSLLLAELNAANIKSVQLYTNYYDYPTWPKWWKMGLGNKPFEDCPVYKCFAFKLPDEMGQIALEQSDGIMVHLPNLIRLPPRDIYKRRHDQLWMFFTNESPRNSYCFRNYTIEDLDDWFNLTSTMKYDHWLYPYDLKRLHDYDIMHEKFKLSLKNKAKPSKNWKNKKLALWFVSKCNAPSKREFYVRNLSEYIDIDIFGRNNCNMKNYKPDPCADEECYTRLFGSYKFYLSFENANCSKYITEKYFKLYYPDMFFNVDIIPVVKGASYEDYLHVAPDNHSFIFAESFESPKALADYLSYLDSNQTAYNEYLKWKFDLKKRILNFDNRFQDHLIQRAERNNPFCKLCKKLHDNFYLKSYRDREPIKISQVYNPELDCKIDGETTHEDSYRILSQRTCFRG